MFSDRNRSLVLEFYAAFDHREMDRALSMLAPHFMAHLAGVPDPLDAEAFQAFGLEFYNAFTNGQHTFDQVIVTENQVVTCGTFTASHEGKFQGLPPTGRPITISVMHIDRLEQDYIVEHWGYGDALSLMQQLGIVFLPGPQLLGAALGQAVSKYLP